MSENPTFTPEQMQAMQTMMAMQNKPQTVVVKNNMAWITKFIIYCIATVVVMSVLGSSGLGGGAITGVFMVQQIGTVWALWNA